MSAAPVPEIGPAPDGVIAHLLALATLPKVGPGLLGRWLRGPGPEAVWELLRAGQVTAVQELSGPGLTWSDGRGDAMARATATVDPGDLLDRHRSAGLHLLVPGYADYPARLASDPAPPSILIGRGDLGVLTSPTVGIVGTRNATRAGRELAEELGTDLARAGVAVISGLALGIDAASHRGALEALAEAERAPAVGRPVGVVAAGLDIAYPARHGELHREVARHGLLLGETPLGMRPSEWRFPARNRIIAGLADAVVVVESRAKGGSMLTASEALERDVPVLAIPGHPHSPASVGTNELLVEGAMLVRSAADILGILGVEPPVPAADELPPGLDLPPNGDIVLRALGLEPASLPELLGRCSLPLDDLATALTRLEGMGTVVRDGQWYERVGGGGAR